MTKKHKKSKKSNNNKSTEFTISKIKIWKTASLILGILLIISIFTGGFGGGSNNDGTVRQVQPQTAQPNQAAPSAPADMKTLIDDDSIKGDVNAKVTIVEWSDYECPFCTKFYEQTLPSIQSEYIDTGKVNFVYRDFPLNFHKNAQKAAEAAECAGEQEKYFEMHDLLFDKGVAGGVSSFKQFASQIGLDTSKFNDCLDSGAMASEVQADMQAGAAAGIRGTPGFIINGQLISGAQPFSAFKQIIDAELAK